jgi:hypothetical protein
MKKNTYPVAGNKQAEEYRKIFNNVDNNVANPGRVKGINNSPNLIKLFPESPIYAKENGHAVNDRGNLLSVTTATTGPLTNEVITNMFAKVVDGNGDSPHVLVQASSDGDFTSSKNYNWLYRDQPMDMNFNYLKADANAPSGWIRSSPDAVTAPVGSNAPIPNGPSDKPFWGHANLQVPSSNPFEERETNTAAQLKRGSGGFGTSYPISNRAFASQEKIGKYFTETYVNPEVAGTSGSEIDRMTYIEGKSIINVNDGNKPAVNPDYTDVDIPTLDASISTVGTQN